MGSTRISKTPRTSTTDSRGLTGRIISLARLFGICPSPAQSWAGAGWRRRSSNNWTLSGYTSLASGSPTELGLSISGQDAGNRLLGTYTAGNLSGQAPRFFLNGDPQTDGRINMGAFTVPGVNQIGPYPRFYLRNPGIHNQD